MSSRILALCLSLVLCVVACASHGKEFSLEDARRVDIGMSQAQIVEIMGCDPSDVHKDATGELWMWNRVVVTPTSNQSKSFAVKFKNGIAIWIQR